MHQRTQVTETLNVWEDKKEPDFPEDIDIVTLSEESLSGYQKSIDVIQTDNEIKLLKIFKKTKIYDLILLNFHCNIKNHICSHNEYEFVYTTDSNIIKDSTLLYNTTNLFFNIYNFLNN
jgi:hypothetical protein